MTNKPTIDDVRFQQIVWSKIQAGQVVPTTTCIFTDGCAGYWVGWWSNEDYGIRIWGPKCHTLMDMPSIRRLGIKWWAQLGNFEAVTA